MKHMIEHTLLKPEANLADIEAHLEEAIALEVFGVCVNPLWVAKVRRFLDEKHSPLKIVSVVGFPTGAQTSEVKVFEARKLIEQGADEIDMVACPGLLKTPAKHEQYQKDIESVRAACGENKLKVIIETGLLSKDEIVQATELVCRAGADFVKTCTGFAAGKAEVEDVSLIAETITDGVSIKASAGIRTLKQAQALITAGAARIGTSQARAILNDEPTN